MLIRFDGAAGGGNGGGGAGASGGDAGAGGNGGGGSAGGASSLLDGGAGGGAGAGGQDAGNTQVAKDWREALPEPMRKGVAAKYATVEELVRGFDNAQQLIGKPTENLVEITKDMKPEAVRGVLERLGLPKDMEGYKLAAPKAGGELMQMDHANMKALATEAHKLGILPAQFQGLIEIFGGQVASGQKAAFDAQVKLHADEIAALKAEWGEAFDKNVALANQAVKHLGGDEAGGKALREALLNSGLGTNGPILKAFTKIGEMLAEDGGGGDKGDFSAAGGPKNTDALVAEATRLVQQSMNTTNVSEQRALQKQAQELYARAEKYRK